DVDNVYLRVTDVGPKSHENRRGGLNEDAAIDESGFEQLRIGELPVLGDGVTHEHRNRSLWALNDDCIRGLVAAERRPSRCRLFAQRFAKALHVWVLSHPIEVGGRQSARFDEELDE